ncbi:glycoside hydrolase superfamily [Aspergillus californicus]
MGFNKSLLSCLPFLHVALCTTTLATTPQMGWNSWNAFKSTVNYTIVQDTIKLFDKLGLKEAGYNHILLDDGWASYNRTEDGYLQANITSFPQGIKELADEVHAEGLKLGLYGDSGYYTCAWRPGSWGYEERDAQSFASWGVDYLKYDNCGGFQSMTEAPQVRFGAMQNALALSGRRIFYSVCAWGFQFPWHWGGDIGHSYRMSGDITTSFANETACECKTAYCLNTGYAGCSVVTIINKMKEISQYQQQGHWMDMDMLEIGNANLTLYQQQTHFSFWAALKSPLIIGADLTRLTEENIAVLTNREIIAVNQDSVGEAVVYRGDFSEQGVFQVWTGKIKGGYVVLVLNERSYSQSVSLTFSGLGVGTPKKVVELWSNRVLQDHIGFNGTLGAYQTLVFRLQTA